MGKKKKKLKKRCCGKFLKEGKHCKNCPILIRKSSPETGTGPERKKAGKKKKDRKGKKDKDTGKEKKK